MTELEFLNHHQLTRNPFVDEDAQTDTVFREYCIAGTFHPSWSKVLGDARQPASAIVFGAKGSGKTAMRLQLGQHVLQHNTSQASQRVFLIEYDDFNSYLGPFEEHLKRRSRKNADKILQQLRLWDHMDAILSQGVTQLVDCILTKSDDPHRKHFEIDRAAVDKLDRGQCRDLLLLTAIYDRSRTSSLVDRFNQLKSRLRFRSISTWLPLTIGFIGTAFAGWLSWVLYAGEALTLKQLLWATPLLLVAAWSWYLARFLKRHWLAFQTCKSVRVIKRDVGQLRQLLQTFKPKELDEQPVPQSQRSDDRYAMLEKLQLLLRTLGYPGLIVIVDRVDEPDLVNGQPERMRQLIWPLMDNKLLKHENIGIKMLLPVELQAFVDRENREFHERARLDKQNVVTSFDWTGEALYDLLASRMKACAIPGAHPSPKSLLGSDVSEQRLIAALQSLRTPRNVFRFLYQLIADQCKRFRSEAPQFQISSELFESSLAVYQAAGERLNRAV